MANITHDTEGKKIITISVDEYRRLAQAQIDLNFLEAGGVDNWDYYSDCFDNSDYTESCKALEAEIAQLSS